MKIYLLTNFIIEEDYESFEHEIFTDESKAIEKFNESVEPLRESAEKQDWVIECDDETNFLAYKDGYYCQCNYRVKLETFEI